MHLNFLKGKKLFGRDAQDFVNGAVNIGDLLFKQDGKTFGEKLPELLARGLHLFGKQNYLGGKTPPSVSSCFGTSKSHCQSANPGSMQECWGNCKDLLAQYGMEETLLLELVAKIALDGAGPNKAKEIGQMH